MLRPLASPPPPRRLAALWWASPFLLALAFVLAVAGWLQWSEVQERDDERRTLISDALTLQSRIGDWVATEQLAVDTLAQRLAPGARADDLLRQAAVTEGLRRLWISVTVLDEANRIRLQLPERQPQSGAASAGSGPEGAGISAHLSAPLPGQSHPEAQRAGRVIVRFDPAALLRQTVPWWLAHKYTVRLVDGFDQVIATAGDAPAARGHASHRVSIDPLMVDTFLELTVRDARKPWWTTLPLALMVVFLSLTGAATWMLRRQMRVVARAELAWRTETAWRRAIEDSLTVGLRGRDAEGRLVHVNRAFCDLVGFAPEQLLGRLPPMPYWPPDQLEESMSRHLRNMAGQAPREGYETRFVRADGRHVDVMLMEAPLVDADGQHVGWMASVVDITERKRLEERERRQTEAMAHQARLTTLGEVASALAHQLNQPLTAIAGYNAGVLRMLERSGAAEPVVLQAVRRLGEQAAEAGRIVQRIREFLTRRAPQREACDLAQVLKRAVELLKRDLQRHHVKLQFQLAPVLPSVSADPVLIEQVVINLVRNAMDEMAASGATQGQITLTAVPVGERFVRVDVDDDGPGLRGRGIEQLTAPFYSTKTDGMGMGLAICRSVIEAHHGGMDATASPRGGARFSFTLPQHRVQDDDAPTRDQTDIDLAPDLETNPEPDTTAGPSP